MLLSNFPSYHSYNPFMNSQSHNYHHYYDNNRNNTYINNHNNNNNNNNAINVNSQQDKTKTVRRKRELEECYDSKSSVINNSNSMQISDSNINSKNNEDAKINNDLATKRPKIADNTINVISNQVLTQELSAYKFIHNPFDLNVNQNNMQNEKKLSNTSSTNNRISPSFPCRTVSSADLAQIFETTFGNTHNNNQCLSRSTTPIQVILNDPNNTELIALFHHLHKDSNCNFPSQLLPNIHTLSYNGEFSDSNASNNNNLTIENQIESLHDHTLTAFFWRLGLNPNHYLTLAIFWKFECKTWNCITLAEFVQGMNYLKCKSLQQLHQTLQRIQTELQHKSQFKSFYRYVAQQTNKKTISIHSAIHLVNCLLLDRFPRHIPQFSQFLQQLFHNDSTIRITQDQWNSIYEWCIAIEPYTLLGYEFEGSWPILFDEFVEWCRIHYPNELDHTIRAGPIQSKEFANPNSPNTLIDAFSGINVNSVSSPIKVRQSSELNINTRHESNSGFNELACHSVFPNHAGYFNNNKNDIDKPTLARANTDPVKQSSPIKGGLNSLVNNNNKSPNVKPLDADDSDNEIANAMSNNDNDNENVINSNNDEYWPTPASPHSPRTLQHFNSNRYNKFSYSNNNSNSNFYDDMSFSQYSNNNTGNSSISFHSINFINNSNNNNGSNNNSNSSSSNFTSFPRSLSNQMSD